MKIVDTTKNCIRFDTLSCGQVCKIEWDDGSTSYAMKIEPVKDADFGCTYNALDLDDGLVLCINGDTPIIPLAVELRIV